VTHDGSPPKPDIARAEAAIAKVAAAYPDVTEDRPWGHRAFKVRGKTFLFTASDKTGLGISVKLPESGVVALELPFAEPTGYGLGKSGWVSARWSKGKDVPLGLVTEWLAESYRAIAPKKLVAAMASAAGGVTKPPAAARKTATPTKARAAKARPAKKARSARKARPEKKTRRR
jgi:predicted DNA-binding protein (MmcQ/YjbR family)